MIVGVPKEIKSFENRVGLSPASVKELTSRHINVFIQSTAGFGSGYNDEDYINSGAKIVNSIEELYQAADLIIKVKEPQESEYYLLNAKHTLFTYLHIASSKSLTDALIKSKATCIAYETVQKTDGSLPLLLPMSEIAGRLSAIEGSKYLQKTFGGKGKLISSVPGAPSTNVLILGGGIVGLNAAKMAAGLGASVIIMDKNVQRLRHLEDILPPNVKTLYSNRENLLRQLPTSDLIIGAVLIPGAAAPKIIQKQDLFLMEKGTVLVDVAIDQGGCFETSRSTTHMNPVYEIDGIIHYCVTNMPGCVPRTSTEALNNATLPYIIEIAEKGITEALKNSELLYGLNISNGKLHLKNLLN